jgi:hypothetical protein
VDKNMGELAIFAARSASARPSDFQSPMEADIMPLDTAI